MRQPDISLIIAAMVSAWFAWSWFGQMMAAFVSLLIHRIRLLIL